MDMSIVHGIATGKKCWIILPSCLDNIFCAAIATVLRFSKCIRTLNFLVGTSLSVRAYTSSLPQDYVCTKLNDPEIMGAFIPLLIKNDRH